LACWSTLHAYEERLFDFIVSVSARDRALTSAGIAATEPTFSSLDDLLREICETTGFTEYDAIEDKSERLKAVKIDILSQFRGLLFVDNLETVDDARILEFLEDLPIPTRAIVTSRKAKIRTANFPVEIGPFNKDEAIKFLDEVSRSVGRGFFAEMTSSEKQLVVNACDRIPLVIEWLIGRSRDQERALKLASGLEAHGKHGDELLEFSFRHIYEEMTTPQKAVLESISLINQPLPIEAVAVASGLPIHSAADVLEELKDYSLVERVFDSNYRDLVYSLLPVTSTFVYREVKKHSGLEVEIRKRLSGWYNAYDIGDVNQRELVQKVRRGERQPELTLLQIARNYLHQDDLDNAEAYFKQALDRNPRNWQTHRELAEFYRHQRKETASALRHYRSATEFAPKQGPDRAKLFREFGMVLRSSGLPSALREAAEKLEIALKESPADPLCRHALGDCLVKMNHYDVALGVLLPLENSANRETRYKTYPLLESCYRATNRILELQVLRDKMSKDK
jgi:tetratricopeptide (TPR) repeat protein